MSKGGPGLGQGRKSLPPEEKKQSLSVRIHPAVLNRLIETAIETDQSRGEIVENALRKIMNMRCVK